MTVAVVVKVFDGIVLAADSATTFQLANGSAQVYNNANKIFHLHRGLPIAAMTWGLGNTLGQHLDPGEGPAPQVHGSGSGLQDMEAGIEVLDR